MSEIERELHDKEARIRELEAALRPFVDAFGSQDWYRRRHDVNVLSEMLCLPVPITPDDIERACKELSATPPPNREPAEGEVGVMEALDWLEYAASLNDDATREAAINETGKVRRALSTGVPEAFRRTIAFAQEECQEPSVMHVSDMARLIRDYAQAELDRALPQPQEGESDE